jgi:hypothetical protein
MRGTGRKLAAVMGLRSTGQVGCRDNHSVMQALQKACSQAPAWKKPENKHHFAFHRLHVTQANKRLVLS